MNIATRLEGGVGDCLLGLRFCQAIKEKYPNSPITAYIDSEGKTFQKEAIEYLYPGFFKEIKIIPNKKYSNFWIKSQYGSENQKGFIENVPDEIINEIKTYDLFYDLHIDSLKFIDSDLNWIKYFKNFPKPSINPINTRGEYIVCHLKSTTSKEHELEKWYATKLIKDLNKTLGNKYKIVIVSTPEINFFYDQVRNIPNIGLFNGSMNEVCDLILNAKAFIGTDSGFKFIAYSLDIPVATFTKYSSEPFQCAFSHVIRWNPMPETVFPLNFNVSFIIEYIS